MNVPYSYKLRPAYGSKKYLIEFGRGTEKESFIPDLIENLKTLNCQIEYTLDLWMNSEIIIQVKSDSGSFELSKDIWDLIFIMAEENQELILKIDGILSENPLYEKESVNFNDYK